MQKRIKPAEKAFFIYVPMAALIMALMVATSALAQQAEADENAWQFGVSIYGWFPDISGETSFSPDGSNSEFKIDFDDILDSLEFALMGSLDIRKGALGLFTDVIYMDAGNSKQSTASGSIGDTAIPVDVSGDVKIELESWVWTLSGYFRAIETKGASLDFLAGTRYLDVSQKVEWQFTSNVNDVPLRERVGDAETSLTNWDVIFGLRGRFVFGAHKAWFVPYYLDLGFGDSDFTWQGVAGLGYAFGWGELVAAWRHLYYDMPSGMAIADMSFSGPVAGVTFRW